MPSCPHIQKMLLCPWGRYVRLRFQYCVKRRNLCLFELNRHVSFILDNNAPKLSNFSKMSCGTTQNINRNVNLAEDMEIHVTVDIVKFWQADNIRGSMNTPDGDGLCDMLSVTLFSGSVETPMLCCVPPFVINAILLCRSERQRRSDTNLPSTAHLFFMRCYHLFSQLILLVLIGRFLLYHQLSLHHQHSLETPTRPNQSICSPSLHYPPHLNQSAILDQTSIIPPVQGYPLSETITATVSYTRVS
jgi:hypothetical protein